MTPSQPLARRVAFISDWYLPRFGGLEVYLDGLARRLSDAGTEVEVITPVPGPTRQSGVVVHRLCRADSLSGGYRFPPAATASNAEDLLYLANLLLFPPASPALEQLRNVLASGRFDAVHIHLGNTPFAYLAVNVTIQLGLPVVATFHSMLMPVEAAFASIVAPLLRSRRWRERIVLTAVSSAVARGRHGMLASTDVALLANATETAIWEPVRLARLTRSSAPESRIGLVATMRLHPRKRPMALLDLMHQLASDARGCRHMRLRIAGDGPLRGAMERRIAALGLEDRVDLMGRLSVEDLTALYAQADLFLSPTRLEAFGLAALEARLSGLPILGIAGSGLDDFVAHGADGILAEDDAAMLSALNNYGSDPSLRARLGKGATAPLRGFDWADAVNACRSAYQEARHRTMSQRSAS